MEDWDSESDGLLPLRQKLLDLTKSIRDDLNATAYSMPEATNFSIKSNIEQFLHVNSLSDLQSDDLGKVIRDLYLCCSALASGESKNSPAMSWIPKALADSAGVAIRELSVLIFRQLDEEKRRTISNLSEEFCYVCEEQKLILEMMPIVFPTMKDMVKTSSLNSVDDDITAACARAPVGLAIIAAHQIRWSIEQVECPYLGKLCTLVIPSALTLLDHWSPEVKGQGIFSFIHIAKNVNASELGGYADPVLDAICQNIVASDDLWHHAVEMAVLMITCIQRRKPRSIWYDKMFNEMLGHLERHPRNKEFFVSWLQLIEPALSEMGLVITAHFRRIFPLMFRWMHSDDDKTILLVLERLITIVKLTWVRNTPFVERIVEEVILTFKEAALKKERDVIRDRVLQILLLLQRCKGSQFEAAWSKHKDDPNLSSLSKLLTEQMDASEAALRLVNGALVLVAKSDSFYTAD